MRLSFATPVSVTVFCVGRWSIRGCLVSLLRCCQSWRLLTFTRAITLDTVGVRHAMPEVVLGDEREELETESGFESVSRKEVPPVAVTAFRNGTSLFRLELSRSPA